MKKNNLVNQLWVLVALICISLTSCLKDDCSEVRTFVEFEPVYAQPNAFRVDVKTLEARPMEETGKIYFYNNYIFINEKYAGVHVIDNSDATNPENIAFIDIPGNLDVAVKGNILYADNYADLLTIDISNIQNPNLLCRDEDVFDYHFNETLGYFIYNKPTERKISVDCNDPNFGDRFFQRNDVFFLEDTALPTAGGNIDNNGNTVESGQGGSLARFSIINDYLYVIGQRELTAYNLTNPSKPLKTETTNVGWGIETLFPYKNNLFIGANDGMYIFSLTNPDAPTYVSKFQHAQACDPVVVKDDIAYVTLRNGTWCQNFTNQLDVIDVKDITNPKLLATYDMDHPHGLSVRDNNLYLCEGEHGLKVFETDELEKISENRIDHVKNINAIDAISLSKDHLLIIGDGGLYQFDTSNPSDLEEISFLPVSK